MEPSPGQEWNQHDHPCSYRNEHQAAIENADRAVAKTSSH